jgi:flavin-dependent dehydrogenase
VGCTVKAYESLKVPYRGNVLVIGDAAAYVEVEVQGGFLCGFHGAHAVKKELEGKNGFDDYTKWWQESFEFNGDEYLLVAQGYALTPTYTDDELDYLFALTEDQVLEGTYSQYLSPKLMWASILRHEEKISRERPEIYEKIKKNRELTLESTNI